MTTEKIEESPRWAPRPQYVPTTIDGLLNDLAISDECDGLRDRWDALLDAIHSWDATTDVSYMRAFVVARDELLRDCRTAWDAEN